MPPECRSITVTSPKSGLRGKLQLSINTGTGTHGELRAQLLPATPWGHAGCAHVSHRPAAEHHPPPAAASPHLLLLLPRPSFYFKNNLLELIYFLKLFEVKNRLAV